MTEQQMTEVLMPLMGEGINEATLVRWLKKPGDKISRAEPLLEVSTDKVDTEIPAPVDGWLLATYADAGATVSINSVIAFIGASADMKAPAAAGTGIGSASSKPQGPASSGQKSATTGSGQKSASKSTTSTINTMASQSAAHASQFGAAATAAMAAAVPGRSGPVRSSPLVRKIAKDHNIHLHFVPGTGLGGRITRDDILEFLDSPEAAAAVMTPYGSPQPVVSVPWTPPPLPVQMIDGAETLEGVKVRREPMTKMRRLIAAHMVDSVRTSPHVTTVVEIDMEKIVAIRDKHKENFEKKEGFKLTFTPFLIHAAAAAIKKFPVVNVSIDGEDILYKDDINIACAVAIEGGLIVPVIKNAGNLSLTETARKLNDLVTRARSKKLMPDEVKGGTFSITNPGGFGSLTSNPIINQPQVAMLGIGTIVKRPVVRNDEIVIRHIMLASLTFDHRVVDGEGGAMYLATFKEFLESYSGSPG